MYIIKLNKKLLCAFAVCAAVVLAAFAGNRILQGREEPIATAAGVSISLKAEKETQRAGFLNAIGHPDMGEPQEVKEVLIPDQFDKTYASYNLLQKRSGFDLSKYRGKTAIQYRYQNSEKCITLLVHKGNIIGGDITFVKNSEEMLPLFEKGQGM